MGRPAFDALRGFTRLLCSVSAALALAACADEPAPEIDPTSLRTLAQGEVVGFTGSYGSHVWLGVPYAQPPVGELRWRAPRPPAPWSDRREALAHGPVCPQFPSPVGGVEGDPDTPAGDEDCLTLSVYAPRRAPAELPDGAQRWPVMLWIHGGGNFVGHVAPYDGGILAQRHDVVVIAVQYRLGPLGWLRHASLRAGEVSPEDASGNYGTLDLIRALEWVRDSAAAFGGDPGNVTIFGESAGGRDVLSLLAAPAAAGLFHRAISQSGSTYIADVDAAENYADASRPGASGSSSEFILRVLQHDGRAATREEAKSVAASLEPTALASYLRSKSAHDLLLALRGDGDGPRAGVPTVFADGTVLPAEGLLAAYARPDGHHRVPVLLGTNRDEARLFQMLDPEMTSSWFGLVFRMRNPERYAATADAVSRLWKADGADDPAQVLAATQPVYVYRFDWDEEPTILGSDFAQLVGAAHGVEIPFVFGHGGLGGLDRLVFDEGNASGREPLSNAMMSYWTEFARSGNPGRGRDGSLPEWKPWDPAPGGVKTLVLDTSSGTQLAASSGEPAVGAGPAPASSGGLRMLSEAVTRESVVASIDKDPRYGDEELRCSVLRQFSFRGALEASVYAERCPDFPLAVQTAR